MASKASPFAKETTARITRPGSSRGNFLPPIASTNISNSVPEISDDESFHGVFEPVKDKVDHLMKNLSTEVRLLTLLGAYSDL